MGMRAINTLAQAVITATLVGLGSGLLKLGLSKAALPVDVTGYLSVAVLTAAMRSPFVILGLVTGFAGTANWICLLARTDLTVAQPMFVTVNWVVLIAFSVLVLREPITAGRLLGLALTVSGTLVIAAASRTQ